MAQPQLELLVYDPDIGALEERCADLEAALPGTRPKGFSSRAGFLKAVSMLPESPRGYWPLALVDLQEDHGVQARGEHLIATIDAHPRLRRRAVLVAFTRYGFETHDETMRALGAQAMLSPIGLDENPELRDELEALASGSPTWARIGEPPNSEADRHVIERLALLVPSLSDPELDERARWKRTRDILAMCHLKHDGWEDTDIKKLPWVGADDLKDLRAELRLHPAARSRLMSEAGRTVELQRVVSLMLPHLQGSKFIHVVQSERTRLDTPQRWDWIRDRLGDRYSPEGPDDEVVDDAWIPPNYLGALRRFLAALDRLPSGGNHAGTPKRIERADRAIAVVASEMGIETAEAKRQVIHAAMCLEDAEAERAEEDWAPAE
jgi:hypothetical protein